jgi:hypothetical protein
MDKAGVRPHGENVEIVEVLPGGPDVDAVVDDGRQWIPPVAVTGLDLGPAMQLVVAGELGLAVDGQETESVGDHHVLAATELDLLEALGVPQVHGR